MFPIVLVAHNPAWKEWADEEITLLRGLLSDFNPEIHHVGSTAIPDIQAKPIVDVLVELPAPVGWSAVKKLMESNGYICMSDTGNRMDFNKGYTPVGYADRVFHIHFHMVGDDDEILFRDYLLAHPEVAKDYETLKLSLLAEFRHDRDGYTAAKTGFIRAVIHKCPRPPGSGLCLPREKD